MTKNKAARLKQELIGKYGDFPAINVIDFYFPLTSDLNPEVTSVADNVLFTIRMSQLEVENWDHFKKLERIAKGIEPRIKAFTKTEESEKRFNDPDFMADIKKRKAENDKKLTNIANQALALISPYYAITRTNKFTH